MPVVAIDVFVGQMPFGMLADFRNQTCNLLLNGLIQLLTAGRDPRIQGDFHLTPPDNSLRSRAA
jgi:hypothetical protein